MLPFDDAELTQFLKARRKGRPRFGMDRLSEADLAAFVDHQLAEQERKKIQNHLSDCGSCRNQVRFLMKARKFEQLESAPMGLLSQAREIVGSVETRSAWHSWRWRTAGVFAVCCLLFVGVTVQHRKWFSSRLSGPAAPSSQAPSLSKRAAATQPEGARSSTKGAEDSRALILVYPLASSRIPRSQVEFRWEAAREVLSYQVSLVTAEGEPVWNQTTEGTSARLPGEVKLIPENKYFVWVWAFLENGKILKSKAIPFSVLNGK